MAHQGSRIPAWRRLGLALKNEDQSGLAVPENNTLHSEPEHVAAHGAQNDTQDRLQSPVESTTNGTPLRLGKRKHQHEPAEAADQASKKSKATRKEEETNGAPDINTPVITNPGNAKVDLENGAPPATETTQPKGDPNYRKRKTKPSKRRRDDHDDARPAPTSTHLQSDNERFAKSAPSSNDFASTTDGSALLLSTETDHADPLPAARPQGHLKTSKSSRKDTSRSPPQTDRRKSVAFTADTKTTDGNTGQDLFKKWVAEQKGTGPVSAPPEVSNFNLHSLIAEEEKAARKSGQLDKKQPEDVTPNTERSASPARKAPAAPPPPVSLAPTSRDEKSTSTTTPSTSKGKKKDPSVYISYLTQYYTDRDNWKFNKAKQNDVVDNALNIFRIPDEHSEALIEYVTGLKGAGVIERLKERCDATLRELDEQDAQNPILMDDPEVRKAAQEEAQQERIAKERKRRKVEGDVEGLQGHPHGEGYIRRLQRKRAEALLAALGRTAPILPAAAQTNGLNPTMQGLAAPPPRDSKKRKRRNGVSIDESSSDSSSDEESSSSDSDSGDSSDTDSDSDAASIAKPSASESDGSGSDDDRD